jgi:hypothetical protein
VLDETFCALIWEAHGLAEFFHLGDTLIYEPLRKIRVLREN